MRLLAATDGTTGLMGRVRYGTGLRVLELLRLRVKDLDFARGQITVREGKGGKDRVVIRYPRGSAAPFRNCSNTRVSRPR